MMKTTPNDERRSFFHRNVASPSPAGMRGIRRALVSPKKAAVGLKTTHVTLALVMLVLARKLGNDGETTS